jgi:hypothetical protein
VASDIDGFDTDDLNDRIAQQEQRLRTERANETRAAEQGAKREREKNERHRELVNQRRRLVERVHRSLDAAGWPGPTTRCSRWRRGVGPSLPYPLCFKGFDVWPLALYTENKSGGFGNAMTVDGQVTGGGYERPESKSMIVALRSNGQLILVHHVISNPPQPPSIDWLCRNSRPTSYEAGYTLGGHLHGPLARFPEWNTVDKTAERAMRAEERLESDVVVLLAFLGVRLAD